MTAATAVDPPLLLTDVVDPSDAIALLARHAPYTPLGGWYNPGADPHAATRPMWFQNDWVHDGTVLAGSELFLHHPAYLDAARRFRGATIVEPHSVYVNHMMAMAAAGPCHTDNPRFAGRSRADTPMWLLRVMFWSGLFAEEAIPQVTAIWWLDDTGGGALRYWADGADHPPRIHATAMANTALVGDNHAMFHQVDPVGPFDRGTLRVTPSARLAPVDDPAGDWVVTDHDREVFRAPLRSIRVSVLWKADVYRDEAHRRRVFDHPLSIADVAERIDADLAARGVDTRLDPERLDDPELIDAMRHHYPEPRPVDAAPSVFDR